MSTIIISILAGIGGMLGWGIYDFLGSVYTKKIGEEHQFHNLQGANIEI
jgi:hypothetical protein